MEVKIRVELRPELFSLLLRCWGIWDPKLRRNFGGGNFGTWMGSAAVTPAAIGLSALCGICLGPLGIFITIFVCASVMGFSGNELIKKGAGATYGWEEQLNSGRIYYSPEQVLKEVI